MGRRTATRGILSAILKLKARKGKPQITPLHPAKTQPPQTPGDSRPAELGPEPTADQIAERARVLWRKSGCLPGRDRQNWLEAEAQLKAEQGDQ